MLTSKQLHSLDVGGIGERDRLRLLSLLFPFFRYRVYTLDPRDRLTERTSLETVSFKLEVLRRKGFGGQKPIPQRSAQVVNYLPDWVEVCR